MPSTDLTTIHDYITITQLLNNMAYANDTLDWALFESCWTTTQLLTMDLSSHLPQYPPDLKISTEDLLRTSHTQLSGFDGTQHTLSNFMIDLEPGCTKAIARAYVTAYHAFKRPIEEGPGSVLTRGTWTVNCVKEADGEWKATGIKVDRLTAAEGDEELYVLAKQRVESGHGRKALTSWNEQ